MEKFESFYKEKFQDYESEPLPDAFDRIQKSMNNSNGTKTIQKDPNYLSKNSSWILKISISLNVLLLGAMLYLYKPEIRNENNSEMKINDSSVLPVSEENNVETTKTNELSKSTSIDTKKEKASIPVSTSTKETTRLKDSSSVAPISILESPTKEPIVSSSIQTIIPETKPVVEKKKKNNIDQYYDQNAATLKDSSVQLFRKK